MSLICYKNFVDGGYLANDNGESFDVINPATGTVIYQVEIADDKIKQQAIDSATAGFLLWSAMGSAERCRILLKAVALLRERNDELAKIEVLDTGKPWQKASVVDVASGADSIEFFAELAASIGDSSPGLGDDSYYTCREPLGVCAGIGAWNYPLQIACWKSAPTLASGNVMIFKPSEETPLGALKLAEIFIEAGVPAGVFNVVQGDDEVGSWLSHHQDVAKVSFSGEVGTGEKGIAATPPKDVTIELGRKSALIIFNDADIDNAVSAAMLGNFYTQGEVCTNGTRVFVHQDIYPAFIEKLYQRTSDNIVVGDPMDPTTNFGALISLKHYQQVLKYINLGVEEGARLLHGGEPLHPESAPLGYFIAPTIFTHCTDEMTICREEISGPIMSVLTFDDEDEVIRRTNATEYDLATGVFTQDLSRAHRVARQIDTGICWINSYGLSPEEIPVDDYKQSGISHENGLAILNHYTQLKAVYVGLQPLESPF